MTNCLVLVITAEADKAGGFQASKLGRSNKSN